MMIWGEKKKLQGRKDAGNSTMKGAKEPVRKEETREKLGNKQQHYREIGSYKEGLCNGKKGEREADGR